MKKALVVRLGAYGDMIQISPLLRKLKEDGYYVSVYTKKRAQPVLLHNPRVDEIIIHDDTIKPEELPELYKKLETQCDRFINLSGSIEGGLLKIQGTMEYEWPKWKRHVECNVNYVDRTMSVGGYESKGEATELFFSLTEERQAKKLKQKHKGKFFILWALAGSSYHKAYPYAEYVARAILNAHEDVVIYTVGDAFTQLIEWQHPRTHNASDLWSIRKTMSMTKYADLVIGPETGVLNAAGCFDTPKIIFLSHSTEENLSKYWKNVNPIIPSVDCYPCHRLIYENEQCELEPGIKSPICASRIPWRLVVNEIEAVYKKWREKKWGHYMSGTEHSMKRMENCMAAR